MKTEYKNKMLIRLGAIIITVACFAVACTHSSKTDNQLPASTDDEEFIYHEIPDTTSAEVAEWLGGVSIDSAERVISRHNGFVMLNGKRTKVWFRDIVRTLPQQAMKYPFQELIDSMYFIIREADDGRLRFFNWNTGLGGTSPDIALDVLYREDDGTVVTVENSEISGGLYFETYTLKSDDGKNIYLINSSLPEGTNYSNEIVKLCYLDGHELKSLSQFPGNKSHLMLEHGWGGDFVVDSNSVYKPVFIYNDDGGYGSYNFYDRYLHYQWNGHCFDSLGNVGNPRLHPSLRDYMAKENSYDTKSLHIRIDKMDNNTFRYASWNSYKKLSDTPNTVIHGGYYDKESYNYIFENNGYKYIVGYIPEKYRNDHLIDNGVTVMKDGNILFSQRLKEKAIE